MELAEVIWKRLRPNEESKGMSSRATLLLIGHSWQ